MRLVILLIVIGIVLAIFCVWKVKEREQFKVLGAMGNLKGLYYKCLHECEKSDPTKHMTPSKGSMTCLAYCDSIITDLSRRGGPSYPLDLPIDKIPVTTGVDLTYQKCGDGTHGNRCRSLLGTSLEIDDKCRQDCQYSTMSDKDCMVSCSKIRSPSKSSGWSWK